MFPDLCETCYLRQINQQPQTMQPMQSTMQGTQMIPGAQLAPGMVPGGQMPMMPIGNVSAQEPPVEQNIGYMQGYLGTQIGRKVKVSFLIGTDSYTDREGTLLEVGVSYIVLLEAQTDDLLMCDLYSIKFVRFYY